VELLEKHKRIAVGFFGMMWWCVLRPCIRDLSEEEDSVYIPIHKWVVENNRL